MAKRKQAATSHDETDPGASAMDKVQPAKKCKVKKGSSTSTGNPAVGSNEAPDASTFPFLNLPAELRIAIYEYALIEEGEVQLTKSQTNSLRTVERLEKTSPLVPALLRLNKQVYEEAIGILYTKNDFYFWDTIVIAVFFDRVGLENFQRIRTIRAPWMGYLTRSWDSKDTYMCFAYLALATELQALRIRADDSYVERPGHVANQVWRVAAPWFHAIGKAKRRRDAGLGILKIDYQDPLEGPTCNPREVKNAHEKFKEELKRRLNGEQERIKNKPHQPKPKKLKSAKKDIDTEN